MTQERLDIWKGRFYNTTFYKGVFIYEMQPGVHINMEMYLEFHESMRTIYSSIGRQFPLLIHIHGLIVIDQQARREAKLNREEHLAFVSAIVTPSRLFQATMKLIYTAVGSKSLPREFFSEEKKAIEWLSKKGKELQKEPISSSEVLENLVQKA